MNIRIVTLQRIKNLHLPVLFFFLLTAVVAPAHASEDLCGQTLTRVDSKYVCMINNERFQKEQIPVVVDGKTYYGCCRMCKETLRKDPRSRIAVDPVSGKGVDKATAVIGVSPDGQAYYFENEAHLAVFTPPVKR
jgi:YHS domain-containing protein